MRQWFQFDYAHNIVLSVWRYLLSLPDSEEEPLDIMTEVTAIVLDRVWYFDGLCAHKAYWYY
ncbi:MAG: hypothetical protein IKT00_03575 [Prevotella sp.]|nr:hypothetical protein [Prevotella sp.]